MRRVIFVLICIALLGVVPLSFTSAPAFAQEGTTTDESSVFTPAATITVNSLADTTANDGQCTLREAIIAANNNVAGGGCAAGSASGVDTLDLSGLNGSIQLLTPLPTLVSNITINGAGASDLTLQRVPSSTTFFRLLRTQNATVIVRNLTLSDGRDASGGAIAVQGGTVTLENVVMSGNYATSSGGALYAVDATLTIANSTLSGNTADSSGGGLFMVGTTLTIRRSTLSDNEAGSSGGAGFVQSGEGTWTNVTISGNTAASSGGGLYLAGGSLSIVNNVTIAANSAPRGGGVSALGASNISNTIIAGNTGGDCTGNANSIGYTLVQTITNCNFTGSTGTDLTGVDPLLGALADNGGSTQTHLPGAGSPAIDAGSPTTGEDNSCAAVDQRGITRPVGSACDIGAVEAEAAPVAIPILESSPTDGESGVAVTRETILRFRDPLNPATITASAIRARFAGQTLPARLHISPDNRTVTLFYDDPLPPSARVRVTVDGNALRTAGGQPVDVDNNGTAGGIAEIDFDTLSLTVIPGTQVCGVVYASELNTSNPNQGVNVPLNHVKITVDSMETTLFTYTDATGSFCLNPAPAGRFFVHIDGQTATNSVPPGAYYPFVGKSWESVIGTSTSIGEVFLPLVTPGTLQPVSPTTDTEIGFSPTVLAQFPQFADVQITVPADSLYADNGTRGGQVGIAPVPPDRLPGYLPPGLDFPIVITVQTDGATNFDEPVPACFPNLPSDTLPALLPGEKSALWSFNHDTGEFEIVGPMTVSADGSLVCTDPGVGIVAPGWHGTQPGVSGTGGKKYDDNDNSPVDSAIEAAFRKFLEAVAVGFTFLSGSDDAFAGTQLMLFLINDDPNLVSRWDTNSGVAQDIRAHQNFQTEQQRMEALLQQRVQQAVNNGQSNVNNYTDNLNGLRFYDGGFPTTQLAAGIGMTNRTPTVDVTNVQIHPDGSYTAQMEYTIQDRYEFDADDAGKSGPDGMARWLQEKGYATPYTTEVKISIPVSGNVNTPIVMPPAPFYPADEIISKLGAGLPETWTYVNGETLFIWNPDGSEWFGTVSDTVAGAHYFVIENTNNNQLIRGITENSDIAHSAFTLAPNTVYVERLLRPDTLEVGISTFRTSDAGTIFELPPIVFRTSTSPDTDNDLLTEEAEFVIGTSPTDADSDDDGILDGAEVQQGTDPLDNAPARTGIIATVNTPGTALDVCAANDIASVASGSEGITVLNVAGINPTIIAQVNTPGNGQAIACAGDLVAVADGASGLAIIDVSDPPSAYISHQVNIGGSANEVTVAGSLAYVASSNRIIAIDLLTGLETSQITLTGGNIDDLSVSQDWLYVLTVTIPGSHTVHKIPVDPILVDPIDSLTMTEHPTFGRMHLFAGSGYIYVGSADDNWTNQIPGISIIEDNGASMTLVGAPSGITAFDVEVNGSGLAVFTGADPGLTGSARVGLLDVTNPTVTNMFLTSFDTPGVAQSSALYNGLAYVADNTAGLQVINYRASDTTGVPPTIALTTNFASGVAEEGKLMRLTANVTDNVQVRQVQFYLDDVLVFTDGSYPFEYRFITPRLADQSSFNVRARAIDTGGNAAETLNFPFNIVPDATAPRIRATTPRSGRTVPQGTLTALSVVFDEPLDPDTLTNTALQVFAIGVDNVFGTADDVLLTGGVISYREDINSAFLTYPTALLPGQYRLVVAAAIADNAGNALGTVFYAPFSVREPIRWIGGSGSWSTAANWGGGVVPGVEDTVVIDVPSNITVTITGSIQIAGLVSKETMNINGTLEIDGDATLDGTVNLTAGLRAFGSTTINGALNWTAGALEGTIRLNGTTTASSASAKYFNPDTTVTNAGTFNWTGGTLYFLTNAQFINNAGGTVDLRAGNSSSWSIWSGMPTGFTNKGAVLRGAGTGTLYLGVPVNNNGSMNIANGTVQLTLDGEHAGTFSGGVEIGAGTHRLLNNAAFGGRIASGTVESAPLATVTFNAVTMQGGRLIGGMDSTVSGSLIWQNGNMGGNLRFAGTVTVNSTATRYFEPDAVITNTGTWIWSDGNIAFNDNTRFDNLVGATLNIQANDDSWYASAASPLGVYNWGSVTRSTGLGIAYISVPFNNSGTTTISSGTLSLQNGGESDGTFSGGVEFVGGTYRILNGTNLGGRITGGSVEVAADATITANALTIAGGRFAGETNSAIGGSVVWQSGTIGGTPRFNGTVNLTTTGTRYFEANAVVSNAGTWTWLDGNTVFDASARFDNLAGATFDVQALDDSWYSIATPLGIYNWGSVTRSAGSGIAYIQVPFNNGGTTTINNGTLALYSGGESNGTFSGGVEFGSGTHRILDNTNLGGRINGGTVEVDANADVTMNNLTMLNGLIDLPATATITAANVVLDGGTLRTGLNAVIGGAVAWEGAIIEGSPRFTGTLTIRDENQAKYMTPGSVVTNAGTMNLVDGYVSPNGGGVMPSIVNNGTLNVMFASNETGGFSVDFTNSATGTVNVQNGTFYLNTATNSGGTFTGAGKFQFSDMTFSNGTKLQGSLSMESGQLRITGTTTIQNGATFTWRGGAFDGTGTIASAGTGAFIISDPNQNKYLTFGTTLTLSGLTRWLDGYITPNSGGILPSITNSGTLQMEFDANEMGGFSVDFINTAAGTVNVQNGTFYMNTGTNHGTLTGAGKLQFSDMTFANGTKLSGSLSMESGLIHLTGTTTIQNGATFTWRSGAFDGTGTIATTGTGEFVISDPNQNKYLTFGTTLTLSGLTRWLDGYVTPNSGGVLPVLRITGTLRMELDAGETAGSLVALHNDGVTELQNGTLYAVDGESSGSFTGSGILSFNQYHFEDGTQFTGTHELNGGSFTVDGIAITGALTVASNPTLTLTENLTVAGTLTWRGGTLDGTVTLGTSGAGEIVIADAGQNKYLTTGNTLTLSGMTRWTGGYVSPASGGALPIIANTGTLRGQFGEGFTGGAILNFRNTGTVNLQTGTFYAQDYTQTAGTTQLNGGIFSGTLNLQGGTLTGSGSVDTLNHSGGTITPGGANAAGTLTVNGSYTKTGGALNIEVGGLVAGTQYDQLVITGATILGGTLNLSLINSYSPTIGSNFMPVTTFSSRTGTFTTVNGTTLGGGKQFTVLYNVQDVTLSTTAG